jgi:hypothetical protein
MNNPFDKAYERRQQVIDAYNKRREVVIVEVEPELEYDFTPKLTLAEILRNCVDVIGPRGVRHELVSK